MLLLLMMKMVLEVMELLLLLVQITVIGKQQLEEVLAETQVEDDSVEMAWGVSDFLHVNRAR